MSALEEGADPEIEDPKSKTSALTIARLRNNGPVAQIILDRILLNAADSGNHDKLVWALNEGADKDAKDPEFNATPIILASLHGHERCARELKERGAALDIKDDLGLDAMDWALHGRHSGVVAILKS